MPSLVFVVTTGGFSLNGSNLSPGTTKLAKPFKALPTSGPPPVKAVVAKLGVDNARIGFCFAKEPTLKPTLSGRLAIGKPIPGLIFAKSFALPKNPNLPGVAPNALAALKPLTNAGPAVLRAVMPAPIVAGTKV